MLRLAVSLLLAGLAAGPTAVRAEALWVWFGSNGKAPDVGLSCARFDTETGAFDAVRPVVTTPAPTFLAVHPDGRHLYSCNATTEFLGAPGGGVSAFELDATTGGLRALNSANTGTAGTCFVGFDRTGRFLLSANYGGGSVAVFALEADGRIGARTAFVQHTGSGPHPDRQKSPHPHSAWIDPTNRFLLVPDLGTDRVAVYRFDAANGTLAPHEPAALVLPPASGPRHLAWAPEGRHAYLLNEIAGTIARLGWDPAAGVLTAEQSLSALPDGFTGPNTTAEVLVARDGRRVYATNRGHNSIAVFEVAADTGAMRLVQHAPSGGKFPRNLAFLGDGRWLLATNHDSDCAVVFAVDPATGNLAPHGAPLAVRFPFGIAVRAAEPRKN